MHFQGTSGAWLKNEHPDISFVLSYTDSEVCYEYDTKTIHVSQSKLSTPNSLFHEVGHMFHFLITNEHLPSDINLTVSNAQSYASSKLTNTFLWLDTIITNELKKISDKVSDTNIDYEDIGLDNNGNKIVDEKLLIEKLGLSENEILGNFVCL